MESERRQYSRVQFPLPVRYRIAGELMSLWRTGDIVNLSAGGLRFTSTQLLESGTRLEFQIHLPVRQESYVVIGELVWVHESIRGTPEYGVAFIDVSPDKQTEIDELVRFLTRGQTKR